ncbi:MAG: hypothetical protein H6557_07750 [Lewinellaceae bacterium]|nr:hypothetical protein [Phaeodactylibacter sp.]MCB9036495.1 hypothetical protein [Lewinellaceae bacterium]
MIRAATQQWNELSFAEAVQTNGGSAWPGLVASAIGDFVNTINSIEIGNGEGCHHP